MLASLLLVALRAQELRVLAPEDMQADVFQLSDTLTRLHAGLYRHASAEEIEAAFGAALQESEGGPCDVLTFYRRVSALVAGVRCGHTRVQLGERDRAAALGRRGLVPIEVLLDGERAWITRVLWERPGDRPGLRDPAGLGPGQELLALDGLSPAAIRARACARLSDDGFIESGKERELEARFASIYGLLVDEKTSGAYELRLAGVDEPVRVEGLTPAEFERLRGTMPERALVELELFPELSAAHLRLREFGDPPAGEPGFLEQLETSFRTLRERGIAHLVLDLRGNGGGRDQYGARLVSYLTAKPFRYFERIEVTPEYEGNVQIEERDGRRLMLSHSGLAVQEPSELHFRGDVRILIDGFTFSTAADAASVAHANGLARFLGEEPGGGYEGNNSGDSTRIVLHHSGFAIGIQHWNYTTAGVGPGHRGRGVEPDVVLRPTIADVLAGRDTVLARALVEIGADAKR